MGNHLSEIQDTGEFRHGRQRRRPMSIRMQTILFAAGTFVVFGTLIVLASALIVNRMKNQLVEVAREEVHALGEEAGREIERALEEADARRLEDVANDAGVRAQLKIMTRGGGVVLAAMVNQDGQAILQQFGDDALVRECPVRSTNQLNGMIPGTDGLTWDLELKDLPRGVKAERVPIHAQGQTVGYLEYGLKEEAALGALDPISRH
ncbi:hypothetical protein HZA57_05330, partial [Candidatus Poribacteria bacterium]|nr:hypothetical protein [Candidatus Poribacteria bacterium]